MSARKENNMVSNPAFQELLQGVIDIIEQSHQRVAVYKKQIAGKKKINLYNSKKSSTFARHLRAERKTIAKQ